MPNIDIIEPDRIKVVWKSSGEKRSNFHVADLLRSESGDVAFEYKVNTDDFEQATELGFDGYVAFPIERLISFKDGVMDVLSRRLPPRSRSDFDKFLTQWGISAGQKISDFALLGYSQGMLPSDNFSFYPYWEEYELPFSFLIEVTGFRHCDGIGMDLHSISNIEFKIEPNNKSDNRAVAIWADDHHIGYVNRTLTDAFHKWINEGVHLTSSVHRVNGTDVRPRVHLAVYVRPL